MTVTVDDLFGMSRDEYLASFPGDEEAVEAYDVYAAQYAQLAVCINNKDVSGVKRLVREFNWPREDLCDLLEMME